MNYCISYFGQMKNFPSNLFPVSTVKWEQDWFRGTMPRVEELVVPDGIVSGLAETNEMCRKNCPLSIPCKFMKRYREYLDTIDFGQLLVKLELLALDKPVDTIVLMVYEKDNVPCAERPVLQEWFAAHGIELKEWVKPIRKKETNLF